MPDDRSSYRVVDRAFRADVREVGLLQVWRRLLVVFFLALTLSLGLRVLPRYVAPDWPGWAGVRPAAGIVFVVGLIAYGLWWLTSR